jgi:hypothetical protein
LRANGSRECAPLARNDGEIRLRDLAAPIARVLSVLPSYRGRSATPRGEQGMPGADAPAAARGVIGSTRVSHHGHTGITRHSPRNGFNSLFRALPGDRAFLPPSLAEVAFRQLDASVGASGPRDFAVRSQHRPSSALPASTASRPYVRDVAQRPSEWGGTARDMQVIWPRGQGRIRKIRN